MTQRWNLTGIYSRIVSTATLSILWLLLVSSSISIYLIHDLGISVGRYVDELLFFSIIPIAFVGILFWRRLYLNRVYLLLLFFILVGVTSTAVNQVPIDVAFLGFAQAIKPFIIFFVYQAILINERDARFLLRGIDILFLVLVTGAISYLWLFEIVLQENFMPIVANLTQTERLGLNTVRSFFPHTGIFANMMVLAAIYQFNKLLRRPGWWTLFLFLLATFGVVRTVRLKAIFILPVCLAISYFVARLKGIKIRTASVYKLVVGGGIALLAVAFVAIGTWDELSYRLSPDSQSVRMALFRGAIDINLENLGLGAGFGRFGSPVSAVNHYSPLFFEYGIAFLSHAGPDDPSFITDQWWSWFLGEAGIIGFLVFVLSVLLIVVELYTISMNTAGDNVLLSSLAAMGAGALIYGLLIGFAGSFLSGPPTSYYTFTIAGLSFAIYRCLKRKSAPAGG